VVEQVYGTLMLHRRLTRDYETLPASSESMVYWSMTDTMTRRLNRHHPPQLARPASRPGRRGVRDRFVDPLLERLAAREAAAQADAERIRTQIAELTDALAAAEDTLSRLTITRQTVLAVLAEDQPQPDPPRQPDTASGEATDTVPIEATADYRRILAVLATPTAACTPETSARPSTLEPKPGTSKRCAPSSNVSSAEAC